MSRDHQRLFIFSIILLLIVIGLIYCNIKIPNEGFYNSIADNVTIVIPSIGRSSIDGALRSLLSQTIPNWRALVIYDGSDANPTIKDSRIEVVHIDKTGSAGATRNAALQWIKTEWIAFLDDDDALAPDYIEKLQKTIQEVPTADIVVFRMRYSDGSTLPNPGSDSVLRFAQVGISFAIRAKTLAEVPFKPINAEDFHLLHDAHKLGKTIVLSEYLEYSVRPSEDINWSEWQNFKDQRHIITDVVG